MSLLRPSQQPKRSAGHILTNSLWAFLGFVVLLQFGYPVTFYGQWWTAAYMLLYAGMILTGALVIRDEHVPMGPVVGLAIVFGAAGLWFSVDQDNQTAQLAMLSSVGTFQLVLVVSQIRYLLRPGGTTRLTNLLLTAVTVYLLLGGVFAVLFNLVETISPASFIDGITSRSLVWQGMIYLSYTTLTTVGYGDVLAVSPWARSLLTLEAVTGTLFIAIVVARLVGAYGSDRSSSPDMSTPGP